MEEQRITELAEKIMAGSCTRSELQEFNAWYASGLDGDHEINSHACREDLAMAMYGKVAGRAGIVARPKSVRLWPRLAVAASIAIAVMTGGYMYYQSKIAGLKSPIEYVNDIAPGKNGATLTLANGKNIYINDALAGNIAEETGVKISKNKDGQLIYEVTGEDSGIVTYNILTTTRGEQSEVRLPDGTLVFLNAESSLKYPTRFTGSPKREVVLSGEGYFEVAKDRAHPFIVNGGGQEVKVLGTHFNVNTYRSMVKTTLIEGSVRVENLDSKTAKVLRPGQQASVKGSLNEVAEVKVEDVVAWKEGVFKYDQETLENIMEDVARWYNVKIVYHDQSVRQKRFYISANRFDKVSELLKLLSRIGSLQFEIRGNEISIDKK